jgi:orotate phosphoribosyltransferase
MSEIALHLWTLNAVHINFDEQFRTPHTTPTPIFVDTRRVIFEPHLRHGFVEALARLIATQAEGRSVDVVAGDETAGIPFGAWVAERMRARFVYVRKSAKLHGLPNLVEGGPVSGLNVALVTDLVHVGETLIPGIKSIQQMGGTVSGVFAVVCRAPFADYQPYLKYGVRLHYLLHLTDIIEAGFVLGKINELDRGNLLHYLEAIKDDSVYR